MAEIAHLRSFISSEQTTTSSTHSSTTCTIADTAFVATGKYLIVASGLIGVDDVNQLGDIRLVHASTVFDGSLSKIEPHQVASGGFFENWGGFWVFDQPETRETITIQFASTDNTTQVRANILSLIAIRLDADLTENTDWWHNINSDLGAPDPIGVETVYATKTLTNVTDDDYLVLGHIQISSPATNQMHTTNVRVAATDYTQNTQDNTLSMTLADLGWHSGLQSQERWRLPGKQHGNDGQLRSALEELIQKGLLEKNSNRGRRPNTYRIVNPVPP